MKASLRLSIKGTFIIIPWIRTDMRVVSSPKRGLGWIRTTANHCFYPSDNNCTWMRRTRSLMTTLSIRLRSTRTRIGTTRKTLWLTIMRSWAIIILLRILIARIRWWLEHPGWYIKHLFWISKVREFRLVKTECKTTAQCFCNRKLIKITNGTTAVSTMLTQEVCAPEPNSTCIIPSDKSSHQDWSLSPKPKQIQSLSWKPPWPYPLSNLAITTIIHKQEEEDHLSSSL